MQVQRLLRYLFIRLIFFTCVKRTHQSNESDISESHPVANNIEQKNEIINKDSKDSLEMVRPNEPEIPSLTEPGLALSATKMEKYKIWPKGIIPYFIDDFSFGGSLKDKIRKLLKNVNDVTGLAFTELTRPPEDSGKWVIFLNRRGTLSCVDYTPKNFTNKGVQKVVLGYNCIGYGGGPFAAMVLALVGIPPQHNAPDRDRHITVAMDNIIPEKRYLFQAMRKDEWLFHDISYDIDSAGHYDTHKYTSNGSATILPKDKLEIDTMGKADGLSKKDIAKIKLLYRSTSKLGYDSKFQGRDKNEFGDCFKLFKPASMFSDLQPLIENSNLPRRKPAEYGQSAPKQVAVHTNRSRIKRRPTRKPSTKTSIPTSLSRSRLWTSSSSKRLPKHRPSITTSKRHASKTTTDTDLDTETDSKPIMKLKLKRVVNRGTQKRKPSKLSALLDFDTDSN